MFSQSAIIDAMQFDVMAQSYPINESDDGRYTITYQLETAAPRDELVARFPGAEDFTGAERTLLRAALAQIESFLNVSFVEVSGSADPDLGVGKVQLDSYGVNTTGLGGPTVSYYVGPPHTIVDYDGFAVYDVDHSLSLNTALHEIGHALGLEHPFESELLAGTEYENNHYSIMSYHTDAVSGAWNNSFQLFDVLALQDIWGAAESATGNTRYTGPGTNDVKVVWDTGGTDTFYARGQDQSVVLDLRQGHFSSWDNPEDMVVAFNVEIENAVGSGKDDIIRGNGLDNVLKGNSGHDRIYGFVGNDRLYGGVGPDTLKGGRGDDRLDGGKGHDRLFGQWGADRFIFGPDGGRDKVMDFNAAEGDRVVFHDLGWKGQVLDHASQVDGDVVFDFGGGDVLIVKDTTLDVLTDHVFVY